MDIIIPITHYKNTVSAGWQSIITAADHTVETHTIHDPAHSEGVWIKQYLSTISPAYHALSNRLSKIAQKITPLTFNFYSLALWTSPDRYTQLHSLCHYSALLNSAVRFHLEEDNQGGVHLWLLSHEPIAKPSTDNLSLQALHFALVLDIIKKTWANHPVKGDVYLPSLTNLRIEQPLFENLIASSVLNLKCHYGFPVIRLTFDKYALSAPLIDADPVIHQNSLWQLKKQLETHHQHDVIKHIYRTLDSLPDLHNASGDHIAKEMDISVRTLNRRLASLSTNYRGLVENYKLEMALTLLNNTELEITDIANKLGFSDISTFSRAFKRWTGFCPSQRLNKASLLSPRVVSHWELR